MGVMIIIPIRHEALAGDDDFIDYHRMHVRRAHAAEVVALRHIVDTHFAQMPDRHGIRNTVATELDDVLRQDDTIVLEFGYGVRRDTRRSNGSNLFIRVRGATGEKEEGTQEEKNSFHGG
jgi:hypothetical protein